MEKFDDIGQRFHRDHVNPADHGRFLDVFQGNDDALNAHVPGLKGRSEHSADSLDPAVQGKLPDHEIGPGRGRVDQAFCGENADGDGQVEPCALLPNVGGGQVHRDVRSGERVTGILDRRLDPVPALTDHHVGQSDR